MPQLVSADTVGGRWLRDCCAAQLEHLRATMSALFDCLRCWSGSLNGIGGGSLKRG